MPYIILGVGVAIAVVRLLWMFFSWVEDLFVGILSGIIRTVTPTGISLIFSIVILYFSIKYIKLIVHLVGSAFTDIPDKQKKIATPVFAVLIVVIILIKGVTVNTYAKNVKDFYRNINNLGSGVTVTTIHHRSRK